MARTDMMMRTFAVALLAVAACKGAGNTRTETYKIQGMDKDKPAIPVTVTFPKDWHESLEHMGGESVSLTPPDAVQVMGALDIGVTHCRVTPPAAAACLDDVAPEKRMFSSGTDKGEIKHEDLGPGRRFMSWMGTVKDHEQGQLVLAIYDEPTQQVVTCAAILMHDDMVDNTKDAPAFRKVCESLKIAR